MREFDLIKGKKVLITGHTGFKGSWLTLLLNWLGADIKGIALEPRNKSMFKDLNIRECCSSMMHDIRDYEYLKKEIQGFAPDFIFHMAAQPLVLDSYNRPRYTFEVNAMGTLNLLEAVKGLTNRCSVVVITTDKVYENKDWEFFYRENDQLGGTDPYSASKSCAELITASYRQSFFGKNSNIVLSTCRAGNVVGGGDWAENRLIPDLVRSLSEGKPVTIRNPKSIRPWQFVLEPLVGYLTVALRSYFDNRYTGAWNFGPLPYDQIDVETVAKDFLGSWESGTMKIEKNASGPKETEMLFLDSSKSIVQLGWRPKLTSNLAIKWTAEWYKTLYKEEDIREFTLYQIKNYMSL